MIDTFLAWLMIAAILVGGICMVASWPIAMCKGRNSAAFIRLRSVHDICGTVIVGYFFGRFVPIVFAWVLGNPGALSCLLAVCACIGAVILIYFAIGLALSSRFRIPTHLPVAFCLLSLGVVFFVGGASVFARNVMA